MNPLKIAQNPHGNGYSPIIGPNGSSNAPQALAKACRRPARFGRETQKPGFSPNLKKGGEL